MLAAKTLANVVIMNSVICAETSGPRTAHLLLGHVPSAKITQRFGYWIIVTSTIHFADIFVTVVI
jgi:hypothetical protein